MQRIYSVCPVCIEQCHAKPYIYQICSITRDDPNEGIPCQKCYSYNEPRLLFPPEGNRALTVIFMLLRSDFSSFQYIMQLSSVVSIFLQSKSRKNCFYCSIKAALYPLGFYLDVTVIS